MNLVNASARLIGTRWAPGGSGLVADSHVRARAEALRPTQPSSSPKPHYDYRIDFFRGLSLIFIFINHIPDNAFSYLTSRTFALFDSAEVFMFLAGYSAALAYYSLVPQGLQALLAEGASPGAGDMDVSPSACRRHHGGGVRHRGRGHQDRLRDFPRQDRERSGAGACLALPCSPSRRRFSTFFRCTWW